MTKKIMECIAGIGFALVGMVAAAEPEQPTQIDCPLARQPYSSNTVLIDLLLDPRSKAVVRSIVPKLCGFSIKQGKVERAAKMVTSGKIVTD